MRAVQRSVLLGRVAAELLAVRVDLGERVGIEEAEAGVGRRDQEAVVAAAR